LAFSFSAILVGLEHVRENDRTKVLAWVEAVNGNLKALLRRRRGYRDLNYLLLKAQRLAAPKTQFLVLEKAA
jgi:hypothetical protein